VIVCEAHGIREHDCGSYGISQGLYWNSKGLCAACGLNEATRIWGDPNRLHEWWCDRCVFSAQLEHARERAAAIPDLEAQLAALPDPEQPIGEDQADG
jgi:hypothetical protein